MRRLFTLALATGLVMAMAAGPAATQTPQPEDPVGILSFAADTNEGRPGDEVFGQVDTSNVDEACNAELSVRGTDEGPWEWRDVFAENFADYQEATQAAYEPDNPDMLNAETYLGAAWLGLGTLLPGGIANGIDGNQAFNGTFAMIFADIATFDQLVVVQGGWDPITGDAGPLEVPDVDPGTYAVAVACANINSEVTEAGVDALWAGTLELAAVIEASDCAAGALLVACLVGIVPAADPPPIQAMLGEVAPGVLPNLFAPWAVGFDFYCVLDDAGECPAPPPDPSGNGGGSDPAAAVRTDPRFTG